jgi:hypothetical protein
VYRRNVLSTALPQALAHRNRRGIAGSGGAAQPRSHTTTAHGESAVGRRADDSRVMRRGVERAASRRRCCEPDADTWAYIYSLVAHGATGGYTFMNILLIKKATNGESTKKSGGQATNDGAAPAGCTGRKFGYQ